MARFQVLCALIFLGLCLTVRHASAALSKDFYSESCPDVEKIVKDVVNTKFKETFVTAPAVLRLFFHDCIVTGCDASVLITSTPNNKAERDAPDNLSLAGDGFDTVNKAKDATVKKCGNKVSCADVLALATREVVKLTGGPNYDVELGRFDSLVSNVSDVHLPGPDMSFDELHDIYAKHNLTDADMIALMGAHSIGFAHCSKFSNRLYNFSSTAKTDPTLHPEFAKDLMKMCPQNVDPRIAVDLDPVTPKKLDIVWYENLVNGMGLLSSDQIMFEDDRGKALVVDWADNKKHFEDAFILAMTKLGRVGVKDSTTGNIRLKCDVFN